MKNTFALSLIIVVFILFSFTFFQQPPANVSLPNLNITTTGGKVLNINQLKGKNILVVFLPDCDHCQREASEIQKELPKFKGYNFYFISSATNEQLSKFAKDYKLSGIANVAFAQTTVDQIRTNFGSINTPSLYIYSEKGKLVKFFNGETPVKEILKAI
jgi:peroxiredoxin